MKIPITHAYGLETVLEKVGRSLSDRFGIRVVCRGNECATNGRTIFLPSLPDDLPNGMLQVIRGYIDHEVSHLLGKSNFRILKWFRNTYGLGASLFLNMLEDLRVEEIMRQRFPGSRKNLQAAHSHLLKEAEQDTDPMPLWRQLAFGVHTRGNKLPDPPFVGLDVRRTLDMISDAVLKAPRCRNTKGVARLAEEAWPIVAQLFSPPPPPALAPAPTRDPDTEQNQTGGQTGQNSTDSTADTADGPGQSPGQADADNSAHGGNHASAVDDAVAGDDADAQEDSKDPGQNIPSGAAQSSAGQDRTDADSQIGNAPTGQQSTDANDGEEQDSAAADIMRSLANAIVTMVNDHAQTSQAYRIWTTEFDTVHTAPISSRIPHHQRMAKLLPHVAGVRQKLLQTLLAEPKARWLSDKENGRINPRALHRLAAPQTEDANNSRVFRERVRTKRLHTAVTLLVDQSGSMDGRKIQLAADTALAFCEALSRLGIPSSVVGFTTGDWEFYEKDAEAKTGMTFLQLAHSYRLAPLRHTYYKHFHESFRVVSGRFDSMRALLVTPLGESILFAARELVCRREERKVLLVLTDGRPEVGLGDDGATFEHAKDSIRRVERAGIDVALVGIMENSVQDLHHRAVVVNSLDELTKTVMRQLQALLTSRNPHQHT